MNVVAEHEYNAGYEMRWKQIFWKQSPNQILQLCTTIDIISFDWFIAIRKLILYDSLTTAHNPSAFWLTFRYRHTST